jgi:DNA-directed RNA polymerase specialized sigma24 family protein
MNLLSLQDRELLRLVYFEGKDIAAAAQSLSLTRDVANTRLVRARRLLAARLADWSEIIG